MDKTSRTQWTPCGVRKLDPFTVNAGKRRYS